MLRPDLIARVLMDAFADFESKVQAAKGGVALLGNPRRCAGRAGCDRRTGYVRAWQSQCLFAGMAEGRMAEIVHQGQRFGEIDVKSEAAATVRVICETSKVCA